MLTNQLALTYAQAIYEIATEKAALDTVEQQLKLVEATIAGHEDLATLMYHPLVPAPAKKKQSTGFLPRIWTFLSVISCCS